MKKTSSIKPARRTRAADHWLEIPARVIGERGVIRVRESAQADLLDLAERLREQRYDRPFVLDDGQTRRLFFDLRFAQAEMDIADPAGLSFAYTQKMMAFLLFNPAPRHIAMVGLGGGSLAKFCHRQLPRTRITVIEIDEHVIGLSELFELPNSKRLKVVHADAAQYLATTKERFDVVLIDGCDDEGVALPFCGPRFYRRLQSCLRPGAVLVINQIGNDARAQSLADTLAAEYPQRHLTLDYRAGGNRIHFVLTDPYGVAGWAQLLLRAHTLQQQHGLDFPRYARLLKQSWRRNGLP